MKCLRFSRLDLGLFAFRPGGETLRSIEHLRLSWSLIGTYSGRKRSPNDEVRQRAFLASVHFISTFLNLKRACRPQGCIG